MNPFQCEPIRFGRKLIRPMAQSVDERMQRVPTFDLTQCQAALKVEGLQKSVRVAIERRMRKLGGAKPAATRARNEVYCHYSAQWYPLGRARTRCPQCGGVLNDTHQLRQAEAGQGGAA